MPVYMIRWPDGNISFALARNREEACYKFDEEGEPMNLPIRRLRSDEFNLGLRLRDDFTFEVAHIGEHLDDAIDWAYPVVAKARDASLRTDPPHPGYDEAIRQAVAQERTRVEQTRERGQQSFLDEYVARHPGVPPSRQELKEFAKTMGVSREELARWDEQRRIDEVSHIPVREGKKRRRKPGREPH